jgi:hypothetical protein
MSMAENVETRPQPLSGNYQLARFNALRHGVLSQYTILPWEDGDEYRMLLEALVAEYKPHGPTEEHLVEELAGVIWRKRRLRLGENAAHHRALKRATKPNQETAKSALIHVADHDEIETIPESIYATEGQTAEDLADLKIDEAMTATALDLLKTPSASAFNRALAALRDDTRAWWEEQKSSEPDDYDEDETPFDDDAESLSRFLQTKVLPWYDRRRRELENRPLIPSQAFGEAVDPGQLEGLARYEVHLDRKHARNAAQAARPALR